MNFPQTSNLGPQAGKYLSKALFAAFEQSWQAGKVPSITEYLARLSNTDVAVQRAFLEELVMIDLEYRWRQQSPQMRLRLEDYSRDIPMLGQLKSLSPELIGAEYRARWRWGDRPAPAEYLTRFPDQAAILRTALAEVEAEMASETNQDPLGRSEKINISEDSEAVPMAAAIDFPLAVVATQPVASAAVVLNGSPTPREIVLGPYVLLERIGEGGIGQVFKARHAHMNRIVAVKILHSKLVTDPEVTRRFIREVQLAARFDHPHVVRAFDAGPAGSVYFLALEYVQGTDLSRLVKQQGPLPVSLACNYIWQAALGLQYAHEQGMVHRDIKPANLLLTKSSDADPIGLIKVADFGMARLTIHENTSEVVALPHDGEESSGSTTATGLIVMGTIDYMAPEQAIDFHNVDIRADIYSLGCTFYHLLTGHGPYSGTQAQKMLKHQQADIPDIRLERPDVPAEVVDILTRMMAKRPEDRFQTPADVAIALAPLCGVATLVPAEPERNQSTNAEGVPTNDRSGVRGRRASGSSRLSARWIVGGGVSFAILVVGVAWWLTRSPSPGENDGAASGGSTPDGSTPTAPPKSPLDELKLPANQRSPNVPKELVWIIQKPTGATPGPMNVSFSGDGNWVACWRHDLINLWDVRQQREYPLPVGEKARVEGLALSPDGQTLVFSLQGQQPGRAEQPQVWNLRKGEPKKANVIDMSGPGYRYLIQLLVFSADGKWLAGRRRNDGADSARLMLFEREVNSIRDRTEKNITHVPWEISGVASLVFAPDGKTLAAGLQEGDIFLWNPHWGDPNTSLTAVRDRKDVPKDAGAVTSLDFSPDGKYLLSTDNQGSLIWDLGNRKVRNPIKHEVPAMSRFSRDGQQVFIWNNATTALTAYDAQGGQKLNEWRSWPGKPAAWAADGRHVATSDDNGNVYIFRRW